MASTHVHITDYLTQIPGGLVNGEWRFPDLTSTNAYGRQTLWRIYVRLATDAGFMDIHQHHLMGYPIPPGAYGWIKVDSSIVGGKVKASVPTIIREGKNIGRSNATTPLTQALRHALRLYNKQLLKIVPASDQIFIAPMLASIYGDPPTGTFYVQRKYNGVRALAINTAHGLILYSRGKKVYPGLSYLKIELARVLRPGIHLDGELYQHGMPLQQISGYSKLSDADQIPPNALSYVVYDCYVVDQPALPYSGRLEILRGYQGLQYTMIAPTLLVTCQSVLAAAIGEQPDIPQSTGACPILTSLYNMYIGEGYEGAMIRYDAKYLISNNARRSKDLLKLKPTHDAEYTVVGWTTGRLGKAAQSLMILCETPSGIQFPVTPALETGVRESLAAQMAIIESNGRTHFENHWLGKKIIVYFDELSEQKVPLRARTSLEIRTWD